MSKDLHGTECKQCKKGTYTETSLYDNWDGTRHCDNCGHCVKRYEYSEEELKEKEYNRVISVLQGLKVDINDLEKQLKSKIKMFVKDLKK